MNIDTILASVEGWLFRDEAFMLAKYASLVEPPNAIVEIGSYRGRSTIILAQSARTGAPVFAIDPHITTGGDNWPFGDEDRAVFTENVLKWGVASIVRPVNLKSAQAVKGWELPIGMMFIDGGHGADDVRADMEWLPHVIDGGVVFFHDALHGTWPSVEQAISERYDLELVVQADITKGFRVKR